MRSGGGNGRPYTLPTTRIGQDPSQRLKTHGPIRPMTEERGFLRRLFRR